jgi:hypothetical protein
MIDLRTALQRITDEYTGLLIGQQVPKIVELQSRCPHGILVINRAKLGSPRTFNFNCHAYTFGLHGIEACWRAADEVLCPDGAWVAKHVLPQLEPSADGSVVVYFDEDRVTHSARRHRDLLISKWGRAHTWQHGLWEVPTSYGSRAEYYVAPPADWASRIFVESTL